MKRILSRFFRFIHRTFNAIPIEIFIIGTILCFCGIIAGIVSLLDLYKVIGATTALVLCIGVALGNGFGFILMVNGSSHADWRKFPSGRTSSGLLYLAGMLISVSGLVSYIVCMVLWGISSFMYWLFGVVIPAWIDPEEREDDV